MDEMMKVLNIKDESESDDAFDLNFTFQVLTSAGNEAQIRDAFRVFDKDDKGFLTVSQDE